MSMSEKRLLEGTEEAVLPITFADLGNYVDVNVTLYRGEHSYSGIVVKMVWDGQGHYRLRMSGGSNFTIEPSDIIRSSVGGALFVVSGSR